MRLLLLIAATSYILGSIPFGYLLVRAFRGEDVRQSGSGNIGATNVSRKSPILGVLTLLLDALKGSAAVGAAHFFAGRFAPGASVHRAMAVAALFAVVGHIFPVWLKFRGGKGVATGLGAFAVIIPKAVLVAAGLFLAVVLIFRYVSLGSVIAVAALPALAYAMGAYTDARLDLLLMTLACFLIVVRHQGNIRRLLSGTENRMAKRT